MILDENLFQDYRKPLKESTEAVKRILQSRVTKYGIKPFGDNERLPRGFRFKSSSGTNGEVTYNGRDYVYAIKNGEVRVMDSSKAGHNWSETIYKESMNESTNPYLAKKQSVEFPIYMIDRKSIVHRTSDLLKNYKPTALTTLICDKDEYFLVEVNEEDGEHLLQCPHCQARYVYENDDLETIKELNESKSINESAKLSRNTMIEAIWTAPYNSKIFGGPQGVDDTFGAVLCKYLNCTEEELPDSEESADDAFGKLSDEDLTSLYNDYIAHAFSYVTINNIHKLTNEDMEFLEDLGVSVGSYNFFDAESAIDEIDRYADKRLRDKTYSKVLNRILYRCGVRNGYPVDGEYYSETYWDYETALKLLDVLNYFWDNNLL